MLDRRGFLAGIASVFAGSRATEAQQRGRVWRVGWLSNAPVSQAHGLLTDTFRRTFRELGYVEGQNIVIEFRGTEGTSDRLVELATELVNLKVDAIVAIGPEAIHAAKRVTSVVPIVMVTSGNPVEYVGSLARPEGNVTGVSFLGEELNGKLLQLLTQAVPRVSRVAVVQNSANGFHAGYLREVESAAAKLGVKLLALEVTGPADVEKIFEHAARERVDGLLFLLDVLFTVYSARIADFAIRRRLPAIYGLRQFAEAGGLMAYGPKSADLIRLAVVYVDKIFKGARPADLPVEQSTKFELVINLKTAKALGLTIPQSLLLRADQVIQ